MYGTVATPVHLLHFNQPLFRVRYFDFIDTLLTKCLFLDHINHKLIICFSIMANACLRPDILFYKIQDCIITAIRYDIAV